MTKEQLEKILGRSEHKQLINLYKNLDLKNKKILITGANGSIGTKLCSQLKEINANFLSTDIEGDHEYLDITDFRNVYSCVNKYKPDYIINIAGLKYAPRGEHETWKTLSVNTTGVKNILDCTDSNCRVILTSTCKSCNPEIVYGATKLIAERMVLNNKGSVARFYNVVETQGNVFEIWDKIPENLPISVVEECNRYFISLEEATGLIFYTLEAIPGRYNVNLKFDRNMKTIADALYPDRIKNKINRRRGDRLNEKLLSTSETFYELLDGEVNRVVSDHDKL